VIADPPLPLPPPDEDTGNFKPVSRDEVSDVSLLPGQFRELQREVRAGFEMIADRLLTQIDRLSQRADDQQFDIERLKSGETTTRRELDALKADVAQLKHRVAPVTKPVTKRRKSARK